MNLSKHVMCAQVANKHQPWPSDPQRYQHAPTFSHPIGPLDTPGQGMQVAEAK